MISACVAERLYPIKIRVPTKTDGSIQSHTSKIRLAGQILVNCRQISLFATKSSIFGARIGNVHKTSLIYGRGLSVSLKEAAKVVLYLVNKENRHYELTIYFRRITHLFTIISIMNNIFRRF